jgi:peptide/nickel transport system permease protein
VLSYIGRRLALMVVVLLGMSVITFALTHVVPGDPVRLLAGPHATQAEVDELARLYGFDQPLPQQYVTYVTGLLRGDLGMSITSRRPVLTDLRQYLPATIELTLMAVLLTVFVGIPLGMLAAVNRGRVLDHIARILTIGGVSMPIFWLGLVLQLVFYRELRLLPISGRLGALDLRPPQVTGLYLVDSLLAGDLHTFQSAAVHLILPSIALAAGSIAIVTRMMRASVIETLEADYVRTARAKGLSERVVLGRHVLRNSLIPTGTVLGLQIGALLAGNVLAEAVFNWPGIGLYAVSAIKNLDYAAIMGVTLVISVVYVVVNLVIDVSYAALDPRITYGQGSGP